VLGLLKDQKNIGGVHWAIIYSQEIE